MRCFAKLYRATLTALLMMAASAGIVVADPSKDAKLMEELSALRAKLISLWNPPAAVSKHPELYVVTIRIRLTRDHRLVGKPEVLTNGDGPLFEATRDSAVLAVYQAQPYAVLRQLHPPPTSFPGQSAPSAALAPAGLSWEFLTAR
jgi:hypothetical protein